MSIDVLPDITFAELPSADIISILSNLLDNAIEACLARDNSRVVQLTITKKNENNFYVIIVKNTYDKAPVLRDGQFVSTKTDTKLHGIGTKSIRHAWRTIMVLSITLSKKDSSWRLWYYQ